MRSAILFGLLGAALQVSGHPVSHNSHASSLRRRAVNLNAFRLKATAEYINSNATLSDASIGLVKRDTYVETATELVKSLVPGAEFRVVGDHYVGTNGVAHVNFKQTVHGLDIDNADINVNVSPVPAKPRRRVPSADRRSRLLPTAPSSPTATTSSRARSPLRAP